MGFLVFWLGTSIMSFVMEIKQELRMYKDVADNGYKIIFERLSEVGKQLNPDETKITLLSMLIPGINIMQVLQRTIQYNNAKSMILDQLSAIDALEEMSEMEKIEYSKNPTGLNAFLMLIKLKIKLSKASTIRINDGKETSEIFYKGNSLDNITILKVNGSISKLSIEEQKQAVIDAWEAVVEAGLKKYGNGQNLMNALKNNNNISLDASIEDKKEEETITETKQQLNISEQKQALESMKNELLEQQKEENSIQENKASTLVKRRK